MVMSVRDLYSIFTAQKIENFQQKNKNDVFLIFALNIDCGWF